MPLIKLAYQGGVTEGAGMAEGVGRGQGAHRLIPTATARISKVNSKRRLPIFSLVSGFGGTVLVNESG